MPIKQGSTNFGSIYLGSTKIGEAYYGSTLLFGNNGLATIGDKSYKVTQIGNQVWMAENLDFKFTGCAIGQGTSSSEPRANYYSNSESVYGWNGNKYGLLYNWIAVKYLEDHKSELIPGWHVPTRTEFDILAGAAGGSSTCGTKLKSTTGWSSGNGTDDFGFAAFPAGGRLDNFTDVGKFAGFWTSEAYSGIYAYYRYFNTGTKMNSTNFYKTYQFSVRLIKDS